MNVTVFAGAVQYDNFLGQCDECIVVRTFPERKNCRRDFREVLLLRNVRQILSVGNDKAAVGAAVFQELDFPLVIVVLAAELIENTAFNASENFFQWCRGGKAERRLGRERRRERERVLERCGGRNFGERARRGCL